MQAKTTSTGFSTRLLAAPEEETNFNPISGLEEGPLLNFADAIKYAQQLDKEFASASFAHCAHLAEMFAKSLVSQGDILTHDMIAAVQSYTQESPLYKILNMRLREKDRTKLKPFFPYLRLLLLAVYRLPRQKSVVYRGVKKDLGMSFSKDSPVLWWSFTSTTSAMEVLSSDLFLGKKGERTMFNIETDSAVDISRYSAVKSEKELLIPPGAEFEVVSKLNPSEDKFWIIQLKQQPLFYLLSQDKQGFTPGSLVASASKSVSPLPKASPSAAAVPKLQEPVKKIASPSPTSVVASPSLTKSLPLNAAKKVCLNSGDLDELYALPKAKQPARCDVCSGQVIGVRFKCLDCNDYDECSKCFLSSKSHSIDHSFYALGTADDTIPRLVQFEYGAEHGSALCLFELGLSYKFGHFGLGINQEKATKFLQAAAEKNHPRGMLYFGLQIEEGLAKSSTPGGVWMKRALDTKDKFVVARCYHVGSCGLAKDPQRAMLLYQQVIDEERMPTAIYNVGAILDSFKDPSAQFYFRQAAALGHGVAKRMVKNK